MDRSLITAALNKQRHAHHASTSSIPQLNTGEPTLGIQSIDTSNWGSLIGNTVEKKKLSLEQVQIKKSKKSRYARNKSVAQISMLPYIG